VAFEEALFLPESGQRLLQVSLTPEADTFAVQIHSRPAQSGSTAGSWTRHALARVAQTEKATAPAVDLAEIRARCNDEIPVAAYYAALYERGLEYGPRFQGIQRLWRRDGEALGRIQLPDALEPDAALYRAHPALLDACLQVLGASLSAESAQALAHHVYIPVGLDSLRLYGPLPTQLWSHARLALDYLNGNGTAPDSVAGDLQLLNDAGDVVAELSGFRLQRLGHVVQEAIQALQTSAARPASTPAPAAPTRPSANGKARPEPRVTVASVGPTQASATRRAILAAAPEDRIGLLETYLSQQVAKAMKVPVSKLDTQKPLEDQGFDSLMAIEVKYAVESELSIEIPVRNLIEKPTVASLAAQLNALLVEQSDLVTA
jgi:acyl transferase domain-containing protein